VRATSSTAFTYILFLLPFFPFDPLWVNFLLVSVSPGETGEHDHDLWGSGLKIFKVGGFGGSGRGIFRLWMIKSVGKDGFVRSAERCMSLLG
jgi:hypothetical protein